jgi:hypothetical protein
MINDVQFAWTIEYCYPFIFDQIFRFLNAYLCKKSSSLLKKIPTYKTHATESVACFREGRNAYTSGLIVILDLALGLEIAIDIDA